MTTTTEVDVVIIGGGIVGLASAYAVQERTPGTRVLVVEKEADVALHQSGRNSGVLHTGLYYRPNSAKARFCTAGKTRMEAFCAQHGIDFRLCGKVVVATREEERPALGDLRQRATANGVACELIDRARLSELEPHAAGVAALHVPGTGIVDFSQVCQRLVELLTEGSGELWTNARVTAISADATGVRLGLADGREVRARQAINCAGLHSDRLAHLAGAEIEGKIVPFRGEYYKLVGDATELCRTLIYPVPDPRFPFLGVHFTRDIHDEVECGPNAVLAFAREGYTKSDFVAGDLWESLTYGGFVRMALRYWRSGLGEMWRSLSKRAFVKALQRLVPDVRASHLEVAPAGVRAQAVTRQGKLLDDFAIVRSESMVHINNAPSPAATSSFAIGEHIAGLLGE